jgi:exonuclease SbcC
MIKKIKLQNWKSHNETELEFKPGINVLVGPMGSGKSSVLQAICFALFGSVPEVKRRDVKVSELVKRNSGSQAAIELQLEAEDKTFHIMRIIDSKGSEATVRDADGVMLAGTSSTQATAFLKNILKLDEDTFLRTVYAKQNEIDLFLQLNPQERKTRLDELIGVHKFEAARKNCIKLANQLEVKAETRGNLLRGLELEKVSTDINALESEISQLVSEARELENKVISAQTQKLSKESELRELRNVFNEFNRFEEQQRLLIKQLNEIRLKLKDSVISIVEVKSKQGEILARIEYLDNYKFDLNRKIEQANKELVITERQIGIADNRLADAKLQLEKISAIKFELEQLTKKISVENPKAELEKFENELKSHEKEIALAESEIRLLRKHLTELETAEGICPTCSRALEAETKEKLIHDRKSIIDNLITKAEQLNAEKEELELQKRKISEFISQQEDLLEEIKKEPDLRKQEADLTGQLANNQQILQNINANLEKSKTELREAEANSIGLRKQESELREQLHLAELKEQEQGLSAELADVQAKLATKPDVSALENAENAFRTALQQYEELSARQRSIAFIAEEKRKRLAEFVKKQKQAEQIQLETAELHRKIEFLQQFRNSLLTAQESLRKELITAVNELMSTLWNKLYPYEKWTSIQLEASDTDYTLQLRAAEGGWVNVAGFASGGERMLAALVLRLAFAKILAPQFNVLILDEPTHNLDDAAINTLMLALQEHLPEFLEQLFIVTHEEKLAEVGNNIIRLI